MRLKIRQIYIDDSAADDPAAARIQERLGMNARRISRADEIYKSIARDPDPESAGKSVLLLTGNRGSFVRNCPGTTNYTCCGYRILHIGAYCPMDCSYCILQAYYHPPVLQFFTNHDSMEADLEDLFANSGIRRIGTGEFTDSLVWEPIFPIAEKLIQRFSRQDNTALELKTKTADADFLPASGHNRKTIVAWSLNTETVISTEERKTASLSARLAAAKKCRQKGYPLAFHFDPMILYQGCVDDYIRVADRLFDFVDPSDIAWISIGSFRFMPDLKEVVIRRFPESKIVYNEFIKGRDGKMRYFKPLRISLYRRLIDRIRQKAPDVFLYFCMEDREVWEKALGFFPGSATGLSDMLDRRAEKICGLAGSC